MDDGLSDKENGSQIHAEWVEPKRVLKDLALLLALKYEWKVSS